MPAFTPFDEVDVEEVAPQRDVRRRRAEEVVHLDVAGLLPPAVAVEDLVGHAAVGLAFRVLVQHVDLGRRGIALGDRPVHPWMRPAHGRTVDRTCAIAIVLFEDGGEHLERLGARDEPEATRILERLGERTVIGLDRDVRRGRREAITESAVDDALGRAEDRDRLADLGRVFELRAHEAREDAATRVRRHHADRGDTCRHDAPATRDDHVERPRGGGADDLLALVGGERAARQVARPAHLELRLGGARLHQSRPERAREGVALLGAGESDGELHGGQSGKQPPPRSGIPALPSTGLSAGWPDPPNREGAS